MKLISNFSVVSIKKITPLLLFSALVLFFSNCSNDELIEPENTKEKVQKRTGKKDPIVLPIDGFEVSEEAAVLVAQNFAAITARENGRKDIEPPTVKNINRIEDEVSKEPLLYIIEYTKGFSIVSADTRYNPILAYSDKNQWGGVDLAGPDIMIKRYTSAIKEIKAKESLQDKELKEIWSKMCCDEYRAPTITCASSPIFGPYVAPVATWGQAGTFTIYSPSNNGCDCDRNLAGCGPIALSALMTYHQFPDLNMTIGNETIFTDYANWSPTGGQVGSLCNSTNLSVKGPAMLTKICGSAMNAWYGVFGTCNTAVYPWNIGDGLDEFNYAHDGKGDFNDRYSDVKDDLIQGRPVIISGTTGGVDLPNYHIWLIDGWKEIVLSCYTRYEFFNMNWGWCGSNNGWYYTRGGSYVGDYDTYLEVYTNIRPN